MMELNRFQTELTEELEKSLPKQIWGQLIEYLESIKFLQNIIAPEHIRGYAIDRTKHSDLDEEDVRKQYTDERIVVDLTNPHILEDMDYFREKALYFDKYGVYTHIPRNSNPKSEYAKFWQEEQRKWKYGMVRPSDGEWIPGPLYFYWNYSRIWLVEKSKDALGNISKKKGERKHAFPRPYLGDYLFFHYCDQAQNYGKHGKMLKARGIGASFKFSSMSPRNMYVLPGSGNPNFHLASEKTFLSGDKGIWGKVLDNLDWIGNNTPLPKMRLVDRKTDMEIQLGVEDEYGGRTGLLSSVYGISLKDNPDKARGIRGPLIHYEEDGLFPNLEKAWNVNREATEEGGIAYGFMFAAGTGGVEGGSFEGSEKLFYKCDAYNIYGIPNVFDKNTDNSTTCGFFWGAYLNRGENNTKENGEPDIVNAIIEILLERKKVADASNDPKALTQKKAESPITPQEAVMRTEGTIFPISDLKDYLGGIVPSQATFLSSHYIGNLIVKADGEVEYTPNADTYIIREYPLQDNLRKEGGIEIFELPQKGLNGLIPKYRYIAGIDPYDDDHSTTTSLGSMFVFDLFTDRIVAEYTGRPLLANQFYENCYRLLKFYNAVGLYENDKKGLFTYFSNKNILHYLADAPQILKDMDIVKATNLFGNKAKGFNSGKIVNAWGRRLQADWMLSPAYGKEDKGILNLHTIRSLGYLREAIAWNIDGNFDRVSAMTPVMILREEYYKHIMQAQANNDKKLNTGLSHDPFFELNYGMQNPSEYHDQLRDYYSEEKSYNNLTLEN